MVRIQGQTTILDEMDPRKTGKTDRKWDHNDNDLRKQGRCMEKEDDEKIEEISGDTRRILRIYYDLGGAIKSIDHASGKHEGEEDERHHKNIYGNEGRKDWVFGPEDGRA